MLVQVPGDFCHKLPSFFQGAQDMRIVVCSPASVCHGWRLHLRTLLVVCSNVQKVAIICTACLLWAAMTVRGPLTSAVMFSQAHTKLCKSMFAEGDISSLHLERCMRLLPHHGDTGGFFVAVLQKVAELPQSAFVAAPKCAPDYPHQCTPRPMSATHVTRTCVTEALIDLTYAEAVACMGRTCR